MSKRVQVVLLPRDLCDRDIEGRCVIVFDVLRATTTMAAALAAGVAQIRIFDSTNAAMEASVNFPNPRILCGEINALAPPGFDLGNSPGDFSPQLHAGKTVFMSTTNGTRAIVAARKAARLFAGALVNARAVAGAAYSAGLDVTLLCAGTQGEIALEDVLGAGAVIDAMMGLAPGEIVPSGDVALMAHATYLQCRADLPGALRRGIGGLNVSHAGLEADIDFCAGIDRFHLVGEITDSPLALRRYQHA